jgi:hypothetical protein
MMGGMDKHDESYGLLRTLGRFVALTLLVELGLLAFVGISCLFGPTCTATLYSERLFWLGLIAMLVGAPVLIGWLGSGRPGDWQSGRTRSEGEDIVELPVAKEERQKRRRWRTFALHMIAIGLLAIALSALIDTYF